MFCSQELEDCFGCSKYWNEGTLESLITNWMVISQLLPLPMNHDHLQSQSQVYM
jgi:hypothetical protein